MTKQSALDKAKGALDHAAEVWAEMHALDDRRSDRFLALREDYLELTTLAQIQSNVAQAEALTTIATMAERLLAARSTAR